VGDARFTVEMVVTRIFQMIGMYTVCIVCMLVVDVGDVKSDDDLIAIVKITRETITKDSANREKRRRRN